MNGREKAAKKSVEKQTEERTANKSAEEQTEEKTANNSTGEQTEEKSPKSASRDKQRIKVKVKRVVRTLIITFIFLFLLVALAYSPLFSISGIDITGVQYYSKRQIVENSGLVIGQNGFMALSGKGVLNYFSLRCTEAEESIVESSPYVKKVYAKYKLPDRIVIEIEERSRSVIIPYQDLGLLVDEEGYVIDIIRDYQDFGLPVVKGVEFDGYSLGKRLVVKNEQHLDMVITLVSALRQSDRDSDGEGFLTYVVSLMDISDLKNIKLFIGNEFVVNLGDGKDIHYRISALKEIYFRGLSEGEKGLIDFTVGDRPVFIPERPVMENSY
ncbi:MAG: FtsQ-type POTRA domain-containing protein [Oscillospiraceae bacterium]|nr:FtsQ-type POTRA domain-containing protein [Oscillospiraceae bacterium]